MTAKKKLTRKTAGRPSHEPTAQDRKVVEILAGLSVQPDKIADVVNISRNTMYKHYSEELRRGLGLVESQLISNMFKLASGTDGTALKANMFLLNCRFGWTQYAPPMKEQPLGKKELANHEAQTAHQGTEWGELVEQAQKLQ